MRESEFEILSNRLIAENTWEIRLSGDCSAFTAPGQFANLRLEGFYLRRPISVCDVEGETLKLIYKAVGRGTRALSAMPCGARLSLLTGLGNGYDLNACGERPLLVGGGAGVPPMYLLARQLIARGATFARGADVTVILGFNRACEVFYEEEFRALGARVIVTTADGSRGVKGFVTEGMKQVSGGYSHVCACGPMPMLRAVYDASGDVPGQFSFEERMGCGFGACMGCTCKTVTGFKRICKEGPVLKKEEILWEK